MYGKASYTQDPFIPSCKNCYYRCVLEHCIDVDFFCDLYEPVSRFPF